MKKVRIVFIAFTLFLLLVVAKLFFVQLVAPARGDNYLTHQKIHATRGKIYDRKGIPLVLNKRSFLLFATPQKIKDLGRAVRALDSVLHRGEATLEAKIDMSKEWVAVASGLGKDEYDRLTALKIEGIGFEDTSQRSYPEASLAAHLLGFVGKTKDGADTGYFGIEGYYDRDLNGLPGLLTSDRDLLGRPILVGTQNRMTQEDGSDLYLTIDAGVQRIMKEELLAGLDRYKAKSGCVITADPHTMEILGLVCLPDFDLERYFDFSQDDFKNPAVSSSYEPGSTFKPFIVAAALNEKKIKSTDLYNEKGAIERGGYTIKTWNDKYEGKISITRILEKSSNVGMVYIADRLGPRLQYEYIRRFGFGDVTGVDLQGEDDGSIKPVGSWYPIDYATASFGQGVAVTPIQMVAAFSALVNGGTLRTPSLVKKVSYTEREKEVVAKEKRQVISKKTSDTIKKMLVSTVERGEYKWAKPEGYMIGGKTGTAQIPIKGHYDASKTIASFIGFAPADEPQFLTLVILSEPRTSPWGSETAAPLFFDIARRLFIYYNIAPGQ